MRRSQVKNTAGRREFWRSARCLFFLAVLSFGPLSPCLVGRRVLLPADLLMVMQPFKARAFELGFRRVSNPVLDAVQQFWPWRKYAGEQLRAGVIPLWNPYMLCGTPFVGNNQSAVFYPETWLFALLAPERAFGWAAAVYLFGSGSFMFWFLRTIGLRRRAAMVGATAWMYNGFVVGWIYLPSFRSVPGWLPLILGSVEKAAGKRGRYTAVWVGLGAMGVGMQFLAGNLHISLYLLLSVALYALWRGLADGRAGGKRWRAPVTAATMVLVGAAVAGLQLLPTAEFAARSHRRAITYADTVAHRLSWPYLFAGLMPDLFGNPVDYNHWGCFLGRKYRAYSETAWYTGALTAVLAGLALTQGRRRDVYFWAGVVALSFALALGTPLNWLLYTCVPGFRQLPGINRAIVMACFAIPVLAGYGADLLLRSAGERKGSARSVLGLWRAAGAMAAVAIVGGLWAWLAGMQYEAAGISLGSYTWLQVVRFAGLAGAGTAALVVFVRTGRRVWWGVAVVVLAVDVTYFAMHFAVSVPSRFVNPPSELVRRLVNDHREALERGQPFRLLSVGKNALDRLPPNVPMLYGLEDVQGSDSITYGRFVALLKRISDSRFGFEQPAWDRAAVRVMGVGRVLGPVDLPVGEGVRFEGGEGDCWLYAVAEAAPRAVLAGEVRAVGGSGEMLDVLARCERAGAWKVPLVSAADARAFGLGAGISRGEQAGDGHDEPVTPAHIRYPSPNMAVITLPAAEGNGHESGESGRPEGPRLLVVHDTYYPGWRAYDRYRRLPLIAADYCFRAVPLLQSERVNRVYLVFEPTSFELGGFITLAGIAVVVALFVVGAGRRRREAG